MNNRVSILYFSFLLIASILVSQVSFAASENKKDSAIALSLKGENLSVTFSGSNSKAILEWRNNHDLKTSHFVIQRSADGIDYDDAAVIFVPEEEVNTIERFKYSDKIDVANKQFIYYRIKIVDDKGEVKYSKVVAIALDTDDAELA